MCPTLSDKLKSLGVKVGARDLPSRPVPNDYSIERVEPGRFHQTARGETYIVDAFYPPDFSYGHTSLVATRSMQTILEWAGIPETISSDEYPHISHPFLPENCAYLDIETTGLSGGTGTYAFLVGVGRFEGEGFHLAQFFMRDPVEEPAMLLALEEFLAPCDYLATYNGKAFDAPILNTRYIFHGWKSLLASLHHLDLLHLSRRIWRDRLPSRTLGNIESVILGATRTEEDIPGWLIPQLYFDYQMSGDARPLRGVFYHNRMDVLAIAALLHHLSHMLQDPINSTEYDPLDLLGVGRLFEDLGHLEDASQLYRRCLEVGLFENQHWETLQRLSSIKKREGDYQSAVALWLQAASQNHIYAHVELAKYYEHHIHDYSEAESWTRAALALILANDVPHPTRQEWQPDLEHRLARLVRLQSMKNK